MTPEQDVATSMALTPGARRILDAASALFYERGIHAVGVDAIAAGSGLTKRTLYDRFGSKDALVTAYLQDRHDRWWARWEHRLQNASPPRALTVFDSYVDDAPTAGRGCAFLNAAAELARTHPGHAVVRAHKGQVRERLEELVAEDGPTGDAPALAEHVFLLLEGAVAHRGVDGTPERLARARTIAERLLTSGGTSG